MINWLSYAFSKGMWSANRNTWENVNSKYDKVYFAFMHQQEKL